MKRAKKVVTSILISSILLIGAASANAGVIVNLKDQNTDQQCTETKSVYRAGFSKGVIVNFTGVIVNFTGVIVNLTGVIVNLTESSSECGFIPTSDRGRI